MQQLALEEAEALRVAVVGEDDLARGDPTARRLDYPGATHLPERQGRRLLIHLHRVNQGISKAPDVGRRLDHHRARHEHARGIRRAPRYLANLPGVQQLIPLTQRVELLAVRQDVLVPLRAPGYAEAPAGVEDLLAPTMQVGHFPAHVDGRAVQLDVTPGAVK
ncbi:hypothetical protein D9M71_547010 [compost metagenome]